jgi:hypothetical protein
MEGNDHRECPVELRACPEHLAEQERSIAEPMALSDPPFVQRWQQRLSCECGCTEAELNNVVGWCLNCDHVYVNYSPDIDARHFADDCPGVPEELKKFARARLVRH